MLLIDEVGASHRLLTPVSLSGVAIQADIFLEKRSTANIERNAMVGIFLKRKHIFAFKTTESALAYLTLTMMEILVLEYFSGGEHDVHVQRQRSYLMSFFVAVLILTTNRLSE